MDSCCATADNRWPCACSRTPRSRGATQTRCSRCCPSWSGSGHRRRLPVDATRSAGRAAPAPAWGRSSARPISISAHRAGAPTGVAHDIDRFGAQRRRRRTPEEWLTFADSGHSALIRITARRFYGDDGRPGVMGLRRRHHGAAQIGTATAAARYAARALRRQQFHVPGVLKLDTGWPLSRGQQRPVCAGLRRCR